MKQFGLIGSPLGHSLSPFIHSRLFEISGVSASYRLYEIAPGEFSSEVPGLISELSGFNVTIPYKTDIIPFLTYSDEKASLFGAVNTVAVSDGAVCGYNTDCVGFLRSLESAGITLSGRVLLCGSGGVARMAAFECVMAGCDLTIAVRDSDIPAAKKIQSEINDKLGVNVTVILLSDVKGGYDVVINGTPVGMFPNTDACVLLPEIIKNCAAAFDVIYNPSETLFLKYASEAGIKNSNGLNMLVRQAAAAQEIWLGTKFSSEQIETVIELTEKELRNV